MTPLAIFISVLFAYSLVSRRLERTIITAPVVFVVAGIGTGLAQPTLLGSGTKAEVFLELAEAGLVLLLFTDASHTELRVLSSFRNVPARLLSGGMLLTILFGAFAGRLVFPQLSIWEAGILAAILAPTDAGLGQIIVNSPRVPMRIRQALNVEAGLNDGLSVPFLLFFMALAGASEGNRASLMQFMVEQLGYGTAIGLGVGLIGGWLLGLAVRKNSMTGLFEQIGMVVLPAICFLASNAANASMFIAAFVAGLAVQAGFHTGAERAGKLGEELGQILNLVVFFLFGLLVARDWQQFDFTSVLYAVLSLTVVRMVPVAIALIGTRLSTPTILFMGWFGPRGLASIVLGLVYLEHEMHLPGEPTIRLAVMATVLLSIFVHGLSAMPGIGFYADTIASLDVGAPEGQQVKPGSC